jgi:hypothetical protein
MAAETTPRSWERGLGDDKLEVALMSISMMVVEEEIDQRVKKEEELNQSR